MTHFFLLSRHYMQREKKRESIGKNFGLINLPIEKKFKKNLLC
jgi:hypothetical protein